MREKLLQHWAKLSCLEEDCQTMLEAKNLTRAITLAYQYKKAMKTPLLTVGIIQDFHKEVLKSDQRAGKLRDCHVCTNLNFETHVYPPPYLIATQLSSTCDVANRKIMACKLLKDSIEIVAWTVYNILSLHSFHDGNGRVVHVVIALVLDIQFPTVVRNWIEPLVAIRHSVPFHSYFPMECNVSPLLERIQQSLTFNDLLPTH